MFSFSATVLSSAGETSVVFMQSLSYKLIKTANKTNYISRKILGLFFSNPCFDTFLIWNDSQFPCVSHTFCRTGEIMRI